MEANAASSRPAPAPLSVEVGTSTEAFAELKEEWLDLEERAAEDNIFMSHGWQHAWWQDLGGARPLRLFSFRDNGRLVGLAPLYEDTDERGAVLRFCGGLEVTDYTGLVVEKGYEVGVGNAFFERCREFQGVHLDFHFLRSDGLTYLVLSRGAEALGWSLEEEEEEVSPRIQLPGSWEDYLASLGKKDRHEIRRKRRRLEEAGGWEVVESRPETLESDLDTFFRLHALSTRAKADFLTVEMKQFFAHVAAHLQADARLSLRLLSHQGRVAAAVMGFVHRGRLMLYNSGYDPELNRLSPGFVLMSEEVRLAIEEGLHEVDFLRGNERYKYELGARDLPLLHLRLQPG